MKPELECAPCLLKWVCERTAILGREGEYFQMVRSILKVLLDGFSPVANVGSLANKTIETVSEFISESKEHYDKIKTRNNQIAHKVLPVAKDFIENGQTPKQNFERTCCLATLSNIAPMGAPSRVFKFRKVEDVISGKIPMPEISGEIFKAAQSAVRVLYVADNAGEIGFDSLLIAKLKEMGSKVTLLVKEEPFFEDATTKDASFFSLDKLVDQLLPVRGFFVPRESSPPLFDAFKRSDLVISKGTGNYEAMQGETNGKPTIYMLKVKCDPIAEHTGADLGSFVVKLES